MSFIIQGPYNKKLGEATLTYDVIYDGATEYQLFSNNKDFDFKYSKLVLGESSGIGSFVVDTESNFISTTTELCFNCKESYY